MPTFYQQPMSEVAQDLAIRVNELTEEWRHLDADARDMGEQCNNTPSGTAWRTRRYNEANRLYSLATAKAAELESAKAALAAQLRADEAEATRADEATSMTQVSGYIVEHFECIDVQDYGDTGATHVYRRGPVTCYITREDHGAGRLIEIYFTRKDRPAGNYRYFRGLHQRGNWRRFMTVAEQAREAARHRDMKAAHEGRPWGGPEVATFEAEINATISGVKYHNGYAELAEPVASRAELIQQARKMMNLGQWDRVDLMSQAYADLPYTHRQALASAQSEAACTGYRGAEHDRDFDPDRHDDYRDPDQDLWDRDEAERAAMDGGYNRAAAEAEVERRANIISDAIELAEQTDPESSMAEYERPGSGPLTFCGDLTPENAPIARMPPLDHRDRCIWIAKRDSLLTESERRARWIAKDNELFPF